MKKLLATSIAAAAMTTGFSATAQAEVEGLSANAGMMSEYIWRGISQGASASAYAGLDYEIAGFYVGTWTAQSATGLEYDLYAGWGMETESGISFSVGVTDYEYTYNSNAQLELNLGLGMAGFALDLAMGENSDLNGDGITTPIDDADYVFASVSWSGEVFGALAGYYDADVSDTDIADYSYHYFEVSAGGEVAGLDTALTLGWTSSDDLLNAAGGTQGTDDGYIVLDVSKSFSF